MFQDSYEKLELAEAATLLDRLNPLFEGAVFDPVQATVMAIDLPFYPGHRLIEISDHSTVPAMQRFVVEGKAQTAVLNFTNEPIYKLNKEIPIKLNEENVHDYMRFFFNYVRGRHGRFLICESVDDINWKEEPPPAARKAIGKMIKPITLNDTAGDGTYNLEACMVFKDSLFRSRAIITPQGMITLKDEELLIEDMPVADDTFGQ